MAITQKSLVESMKKDLFNEVIFQIDVLEKTEDNETELKQLIKERQKAFNMLLGTMNINKRVRYGLQSILSEISSQAYFENNYKMKKIYLMYTKQTSKQDI